MGLLDETRTMIARLRALTPELLVNYRHPFRDPQHRELYFSSLRLAMGERHDSRSDLGCVRHAGRHCRA
jgi:hypothetical protein